MTDLRPQPQPQPVPAPRPTPTGGKGKPRWSKRKQAFVDAVLEGHNGSEAARMAGYAPKHVNKTAYGLMRDPWVSAEIAKRREELRLRNAVTVDSMVKRFDEDRAFAIETGNATAAVRASELKAKLCGLLVERSANLNVTVEDKRSDDEILDRIAALRVELGPVIDSDGASPS